MRTFFRSSGQAPALATLEARDARNGIDPSELAAAAGFLPPEWDLGGKWTHATPPHADRVFASPAVTYIIRVPAGP